MMSSQELVWHRDVAVIYCRGRIVAGEIDELRDAARSAIQRSCWEAAEYDKPPSGSRSGATHQGGVIQFVGPLSRYDRITHKQELGQLFRGQLFRRVAVSLDPRGRLQRELGAGGYSKGRRIAGRQTSASLWQVWSAVKRLFVAENGSAGTDIAGGEEAPRF
jgi:hypothetical protein